MYCTCTLCSYITVQYKQQWACICDTFITWRQMIRRQRDNAKIRQRKLSRVNFYRESCWRVPSSEFINSFFKHSNICNSFFTLGKVHKLTRVLNLNVHYLTEMYTERKLDTFYICWCRYDTKRICTKVNSWNFKTFFLVFTFSHGRLMLIFWFLNLPPPKKRG